jgi:non-canonical purine NTP pyrophosphatase (RdgB/HAM1 family)
MSKVVFVTGNANKAKYFSELIGMPIDYHSIEGHEIQSLDLKEIAKHKAKLAYEQLKRPVIVEDVSLVISCLGKLPGPFIKWFIEELGLEKICRLVDGDKNRRAVASSIYAYFDGEVFKYFEGSLNGTIADNPRGDGSFGWNPTFIPDGAQQTLGEMDDETFKKYYVQIKPLGPLAEFLSGLDNKQA